MQLVDEQDDPALGGDDLGERGLHPLLELAAVLGAGEHAGEVQRHDAGVAQRLGHVAVGDPQGEALGDRGLADAGLADQHGVVLAPAGEDLDRLLDLVRAPDHGVDAAVRRVGGEVAAELVERGGLGLRLLRGGLGARRRPATAKNSRAQTSHSAPARLRPPSAASTTRTLPGRWPQFAQTGKPSRGRFVGVSMESVTFQDLS